MSNHHEEALDRRLRNEASSLAKMAGEPVSHIGNRLSEVVRAAARVTLANQWGTRVYWYGPTTVVLLAQADLDILYEQCDKLAETLGLLEATCHGREEPTSRRESDNE